MINSSEDEAEAMDALHDVGVNYGGAAADTNAAHKAGTPDPALAHLGGELDPKEEQQLRLQLKKYLRELDTCSKHMQGLSSNDKKKLRNRKASRVSRLRKKLSVYDLTRRYTALSAENREQARRLDIYRAALASVAGRLARHEPTYRCEKLET